MIGTRGGFGPLADDAADLAAAQDRQVQIENDEIGRLLRQCAERLVAAIDDVDEGVEGALERMLDERRDVLLVLDDQNAWRRHAGRTSRRNRSNRGPMLASFHTRPPWLDRD